MDERSGASAGTPGLGYHEFLPVQNRIGVSAQLQLNFCIAQFRHAVTEFVRRSRVSGSYESSAFRAEKRSSNAGTRQPDD